jgi:uncharacterized protein involved in high-affinity Fe2+ transport
MKRLHAIIATIGLAGLLLPGAVSALSFSPPTFDFSEAVNFAAKPGDETSGIPDFYPAAEVRNGRELAPWISFINKDLTLQPGERGSLFFEIKVPADAGPGSYFGAALVTSLAPENEEGVSVIGNTAMLILLKVNGEAVEDLKLTSFTAEPGAASSLPVAFEARFENQGTTHLRPVGEVRIKDVFGRVVAAVPMNRKEFKSVLPGGARRYSAAWAKTELPADASAWERQLKNFALGPYTAELTVEYGLQKKTLTASTRFWVFPWMVVGAALGGLALLAAAVAGFLKWYRKRVIASLEKRTQQGP